MAACSTHLPCCSRVTQRMRAFEFRFGRAGWTGVFRSALCLTLRIRVWVRVRIRIRVHPSSVSRRPRTPARTSAALTRLLLYEVPPEFGYLWCDPGLLKITRQLCFDSNSKHAGCGGSPDVCGNNLPFLFAVGSGLARYILYRLFPQRPSALLVMIPLSSIHLNAAARVYNLRLLLLTTIPMIVLFDGFPSLLAVPLFIWLHHVLACVLIRVLSP
ncbi:hypothetical protein C8R45DRAFT_477109 [Mycena sanguinolenta]|nr:hypothetical protein C8R45DRAFT_477109 [Mycena sanguinolenta]